MELLKQRIDAERSDKDLLVAELRNAGVTKFKGSTCCCPFCHESKPSAAIYRKDNVWRFKCHSGKPDCQVNYDYLDVRARNNCKTPEDLMRQYSKEMQGAEKPQPKLLTLDQAEAIIASAGEIKARYNYTHPESDQPEAIVYKLIQRNGDKTFRQVRAVGKFYEMRGPEQPKPLYNREGLSQDAESPVIIVEGEQDVNSLKKLGYLATTSMGGAKNPHHTDWSWLKNREVYLWPDNDQAGVDYMESIQKLLSSPDIDASISWVDAYQELPEKSDVTDYVREVYKNYVYKITNGSKPSPEIASEAMQECHLAVGRLIEKSLRSVPRGNTGQLQEYMRNIGDGSIEQHALSHEFTSEATNALRSGMGAILVGPPESGKSWFVVQEVYDLNRRGIPTSCLMLEQDKQFFHQRLLAQLSGNSKVLDFDYVRSHNGEILEMIGQYREHLDLANLYTQEDVNASCRKGRLMKAPEKQLCVKWVQQQFEAGMKVVFIDPITSLQTEGQTWIEDLELVKGIKRLCEKHNKTCVVVTHPSDNAIAVKSRPSPELIQNSIAGGKAITRFFQTVLWLQKKPGGMEVCTKGAWGGTELMTATHLLHIGKANNGYGGGMSVAFDFNSSQAPMRFRELGKVEPMNSKE